MPFLSNSVALRLLAIICTSLALGSCGSSPSNDANGNPVEGEGSDGKSTFKSIGADIGCGIASVLNKDCAKGARVGSRVADKVISWVFRSLKTADGKTVNKEYEARKASVSKNDVQPMAFSSKVETADAPAPTAPATPEKSADSKGAVAAPAPQPASSEVKITSNTDLVGYGDQVPVVTQKYALYDEKNKLVSTQTEKLAAVDGAGRYETEAKVKIPKTKKGKNASTYRVETTLTVNGKDYKKNSYNIAILDSGALYLAALPANSGLSGGQL